MTGTETNCLEETEASLTRLLEIRLDNPIAHRGLGQVTATKGDMPGALEHFQNAVTLEPESAVGRCLYGYALQLSGQAAEAIPQLEACLAALRRRNRRGLTVGENSAARITAWPPQWIT